jgi:hypothetical protein
MIRLMSAATASCVGLAMLAASGVMAAEKLKLNGAQIRAKISGMEITDEVHTADVFAPGGVLTSYAMSRKSTGTWRVQGDQLCLDRGKEPGSGCYGVWLSGNKVELKAAGSGLPFEGILRRPVQRK